LLPKAVVRWIRLSADAREKNPNPIFVTHKVAKPVNFRIAEYFLCPACEHRLNTRGENWVLGNAFRGRSSFPLRDSLAGAPVLYPLTQARLINSRCLAGIDLEKLVYFASSVFWRACATKWWSLDHTVQLSFGPYEEHFRQFLLGHQLFADRAALLINVSGNTEPHIAAIYPYGGGRIQGARQYRFAIPGMAFWLHVGHIPTELRAACAYHSGILCLAPDLNEMYVRDMGSLLAKNAHGRS